MISGIEVVHLCHLSETAKVNEWLFAPNRPKLPGRFVTLGNLCLNLKLPNRHISLRVEWPARVCRHYPARCPLLPPLGRLVLPISLAVAPDAPST